MNISAAQFASIAEQSLEANIVHLPQGDFLAAGGNQFGSLWTRDFCFSVPALLTLKKYSLVKNHLTYLIKNRSADGLVPIYADSINPMQRVILGSVNIAFGTSAHYQITKDIKPYYKASGKYSTIDANLLVLKASYEYFQASHDQEWWKENQNAFQNIYHYYNHFFENGLIYQEAFADWQDSSSRQGKTFFTNLLYLDISKSLSFMSQEEISNFTKKIHETFYDNETGLYFSLLGSPQISIDGILWAIDKKLMPFSDLLYERLKQHPLWNHFIVPGFATYPSYPLNSLAVQVKLVGLHEYHGNLTWSWLMAYSSLVAYKQHDFKESSRIATALETIVLRDKVVGEIYLSTKDYLPFHSHFYASEMPFSWGAAFVIEMLKFQNESAYEYK
jgi:glycogen debranching enzyme